MVFRCQQCGKCCSLMGDLIRIEEDLGNLKFRLHFVATGNEAEVAVDKDKVDLFLSGISRMPDACPFLRFDSAGKALCTIHATRPDLCRIYGCFRVLVKTPDGSEVGRVPDGSRIFSTTDPSLWKLWNDSVADAVISDESEWESHVEKVFSRAGYQIVL